MCDGPTQCVPVQRTSGTACAQRAWVDHCVCLCFQKLAASLLALGQEHLFEGWPALGLEDDGKMALMAALGTANESYPGGLASYVAKAKELLAGAASGANPFEGFTPSVPLGEDLLYGDDEYREMEAKGLAEAAKVGFVLVAGGLGERLGYSGIKVELPVELASGASFLAKYADWILSLQRRARQATGDASLVVPLAIMTSGDTDAPTRALLETHGNFGLTGPGQVTVLTQDKVPSLSDNAARLVTSKGSRWELETKPHGHGDVHHLLHKSGLAARWEGAGKDWVFFFQDTNPLVVHALVPMLGVSRDRAFDLNSLCVPRRAGEAAGAITRLTHSDGRELTINVEYNQLDPLLKATPGALSFLFFQRSAGGLLQGRRFPCSRFSSWRLCFHVPSTCLNYPPPHTHPCPPRRPYPHASVRGLLTRLRGR